MSKDDETGDASHIEINEKHLELVQGVINRLAGNGFLVKGWSLTVAVAMIVVIARTDSTALTPVLLIPVFAFWGLDGYFLSRERGFCGLYRRIVQHDPGVPPYSMDIKRIDLRSWWSGCWRMTLITFHGTVLAMVTVSMLLLGAAESPAPAPGSASPAQAPQPGTASPAGTPP
ncbi:hypothetical protein U5801_25695 [Lamprobacter modestohalophilus]|uniref:hypothetical protein n=1 Tax=Lamprobacter modestohalophilus TaxID=1064514 RepID=UPI002ADED4D3|nr:hypothetical protein [Lamprobacter modestohalophilus]MEA1053175.1 hypothetical protein [Lamprobacter modestohalophilus]